MTKLEIESLLNTQRNYFKTGETLPVKFRISMLKKLYSEILQNKEKICDALKSDLGKSEFESYMCEVGLTLSELSYMIKHVKKFAREKTVKTPLAQFASRSYQKPSPHGVTLIMSPWNYPFLLTIEPLVSAMAAGNTAIVKPSAYSPATSAVIKSMLDNAFEKNYVATITGGREENALLLDSEFDFIFFTGSQSVGRLVMQKAALHLTPVVLELGGKSPCIVDDSADLKLAARRIVFGKYLNCGQTCVAPDYVYVQDSVKEKFVELLKKETLLQFGNAPLQNSAYGKIINKKHFERIVSLIEKDKVVIGGSSDENSLKIEPTIMDNVSFDDAVMGQEIFGPVMPILTFKTLDEAIEKVNSRQHPLALYLFSTNKKNISRVTSLCGFGGGCVNDTIIHLATSEMPFGGFRESGMGQYHGKSGFEAFSHFKSIVDKKNWIDLPMRYQPYKKINRKLLGMFLK